MNLRERLQLRAAINLIVSVIERLVNIFLKLAPKTDTPKVDPVKPKRPLKKVIDNIVPWRDNNE